METGSPYPLDELDFTLEERQHFIKDHDEEMEYICSSLQHYLEDVEHTIDLGISHSVVSHLTYNLVLTLAKGLTDLTIYEYVRGAYLLDDDYDTTYKVWKSVHDSSNKIIPLLAKLEEENYFDDDINLEDFLADIVAPHCKLAQGYERHLNLYRRVALKSSNSLVYSLNYFLRFMVQFLSDLKVGKYDDINEEYDKVFLANYKLYKKCFWPQEGRHFRSHIESQIPHYEQLTPDYLGRLLWEEKKDFEHTPTGILWRDYYEDKKDLYFEAKRIGLNEEQWKFFFKNICRFEEYERWIEEIGFKQYVTKPEKADVIVERLKELVNAKDKPKSIMMPIRAAIDGGALERPNWDSFKNDFGKRKLKSKASFTSYTDPMKQPYVEAAFLELKNEFKRLIEE